MVGFEVRKFASKRRVNTVGSGHREGGAERGAARIIQAATHDLLCKVLA